MNAQRRSLERHLHRIDRIGDRLAKLRRSRHGPVDSPVADRRHLDHAERCEQVLMMIAQSQGQARGMRAPGLEAVYDRAEIDAVEDGRCGRGDAGRGGVEGHGVASRLWTRSTRFHPIDIARRPQDDEGPRAHIRGAHLEKRSSAAGRAPRCAGGSARDRLLDHGMGHDQAGRRPLAAVLVSAGSDARQQIGLLCREFVVRQHAALVKLGETFEGAEDCVRVARGGARLRSGL